MRRGVGLSIGAVILSITLGVLVGLVIRTGMAERADQALHPPQNSAASAGESATGSDVLGTAGTGPGITVGTTLPAEVTGNDGAGGATGAPPGHASGILAAGSDARAPTRTTSGSPAGGAATAQTGALVTASAPPAAASNAATVTAATVTAAPPTTTRPSTTVTAPPGPDAAEQSCTTLGAKSADPAGVTLFCQRHQGDGTLRWRAVADGGGCLNQTMTGTGIDGRQYACRRGPNGLNHWAPVG